MITISPTNCRIFGWKIDFLNFAWVESRGKFQNRIPRELDFDILGIRSEWNKNRPWEKVMSIPSPGIQTIYEHAHRNTGTKIQYLRF